MNQRNFRRRQIQQTVEATGKTPDEAIANALRRLHARRDEVDIEIVEKGSNGFLGLGARDAKVQVRMRQESEAGHEQAPQRGRGSGAPAGRGGVERGRGGREMTRRSEPESGSRRPERGPRRFEDSSRRRREGGWRDTEPSTHSGPGQSGRRRWAEEGSERRSNRQDLSVRRASPARRGVAQEEQSRVEPPQRGSAIRPASSSNGGPELPPGLEQEISGYAQGLLERMGFPIGVDTQIVDGAYEVRINGGENDAILIGRRGETLEALQHVIAKMASRGKEDLVRVRVDISNYRERRNEQLEDRARSMAQQVRETGSEVVTEPLSAAERRIIHRTLSEAPDVTTHALGEGLVKRVWIGPADKEVGSISVPEEGASGSENPHAAEPVENPNRPPSVREPVSILDTWPASSETKPSATEPEWGRKPKPAKGRRAR